MSLQMSSDSPLTQEEAIALLTECRQEVDAIDVQLVQLINQRTKVVHRIGQIKRRSTMPVYEPKREEQVFANIASANQGPLPQDAVKAIFQRIIDEMRTVQQRMMK
jgi:chorismate mutase